MFISYGHRVDANHVEKENENTREQDPAPLPPILWVSFHFHGKRFAKKLIPNAGQYNEWK